MSKVDFSNNKSESRISKRRNNDLRTKSSIKLLKISSRRKSTLIKRIR